MYTIARTMVNKVFGVIGVPDILYSDRGLEFTGKDFKQSVKKLGVNQNFTTSFNPQSNGMAERFNRTLVEILRCLVFEQPLSWDESVPLACLAYNTSYCQAIKESPHYIFFLRDPRLPYKDILNTKVDNSEVTDFTSELNKRASDVFRICKLFSENQMIRRNSEKNIDRKFKDISVGDRIFLKTNIRRHKFVPRYHGPYRVIGVKGSTIYCYSLLSKKHKTVNMDKCRLASDLSEEDAHMTAFPEDDTVDLETEEDSEGPGIVPNQANSDAPHDVTDTSQSQSDGRSGASNSRLRHQQTPTSRENRYNLRYK